MTLRIRLLSIKGDMAHEYRLSFPFLPSRFLLFLSLFVFIFVYILAHTRTCIACLFDRFLEQVTRRGSVGKFSLLADISARDQIKASRGLPGVISR